MMSNECFRFGTTCDRERSTGFNIHDETSISYSAIYEENLLKEYLGEPGSMESTDESSVELCKIDPFTVDMPSYCYIDPTRSPACIRENSPFSDMMRADTAVQFDSDAVIKRSITPPKVAIEKPTRRGRPIKVTSTSKMATYARNYREQKKSQLLAYEAQVKELMEENSRLRAENQRLSEGYTRLSEQVDSLRKLIERSPETFRDPLKTPPFVDSYYNKHVNNDLFDIDQLITFSQ